MTDISKAIERLSEDGIEAFERSSMLIIPVETPDDIYPIAEKARRIFKEIGFEKTWQVDPYYIQNKDSLREIMYGGNNND